MIGIYKITSPTNKVYVGQSWNIQKRWQVYKTGSVNRQPKLRNSLLKYGPSEHQFEIIESFDEEITQMELDNKEQYYMDLYRSNGCELLNIREAGSRGKVSSETKKKIAISTKNRFRSADERIKISIANTGKIRTADTRELISRTLKAKGTKLPEWHRKKLSDANKNKVVSPETRLLLSEQKRGERNPFFGTVPWNLGKRESGMTGKRHSAETRKRMSQTAKERGLIRNCNKAAIDV